MVHAMPILYNGLDGSSNVLFLSTPPPPFSPKWYNKGQMSNCPYCDIIPNLVIFNEGGQVSISSCSCDPKEIAKDIKPDCIICENPQTVVKNNLGGKDIIISYDKRNNRYRVKENSTQAFDRFLLRGNWCAGCSGKAEKDK